MLSAVISSVCPGIYPSTASQSSGSRRNRPARGFLAQRTSNPEKSKRDSPDATERKASTHSLNAVG